ncbi:MAG: 5-formyltetrahydrofolate cyclo-ligase [Thermofilum sp. ex4484_15]|nr:MAG: 5-formyltetrahydrofolate cyclo-ligase [Thermofilum sp. ex4484_15]
MDLKDSIRNRIWKLMESRDIATFPRPVYGRIPNFKGAEIASRRVLELQEWRVAKVVFISPDSPQRPLRKLALKQGKVVIVPTPRLREGFIVLEPRSLPKRILTFVSTIKGAFKYGKKVELRKLPKVDLMVTGSVAVDVYGTRVGKGGGYSELEYAILKELKLISEITPIITTVHDVQVLRQRIPRSPYDLGIDYIVTPNRIIRCLNPRPKPKGIYMEFLDNKKLEEIPVLKELIEHKRT